MPCLYTKGRLVLTEHNLVSCNSHGTLGGGGEGVEVGLMDRRTLNFQFLNTREQGTVWSQSFSEEIGCSFSVLRPLSPTPSQIL